jgi:hypothetical protein
MLAEALDRLTALARAAANPIKLDVKDPSKAYYALNGQPLDITLPVPPRDHRAASLDDLIALANRFAEIEFYEPAVWFDACKVVLVIDDDTADNAAHRFERATLDLEPSDVWARLVALRQTRAHHDHKAFIRLLRIDLAGTLDPVTLLNVVRRVKFEAGQITTSEKGKQRESMGRDIVSAVVTELEIPEQVTLSVPVYKTSGETDRWPLRCTVEVEPAEGTFRLLPLPDEIERVRDMATESIRARLGDGLKGVPCYFGKP